jgi:WD40 repeat protein
VETEDLDKHPYHFSIHYSSPANILHYLIRLEPFTQCHWKLNRGFDNANRMFHDLNLSWSTSGLVDMKELIPEFFFLAEFLLNGNHLELGERTNGQSIDDVVLPPWCFGDVREFVRVHRQCLESSYVSSQIHNWIDLIFGHTQRGQPAFEALNVFKPKSYDDQIDFNNLSEADVLEIREFGQTPKQLFTKKHPLRAQLNESKYLFFNFFDCMNPLEVVRVDFPIGQISELQDRNNKEPYAFTPINAQRVSASGLMTVIWGLPSGSLRFTQSRTKEEFIFSNLHNGFVTSVDITGDGMTLVTGGSDAVICIWDLKVSAAEPPKLDLVGFMVGHTSHIEKIIVSDKYRAVVSMDADGIVVVWDLDRLCPSFFLSGFESSLTTISFDSYSGDIAVFSTTSIHVYSINGRHIASAKLNDSPISFGVLVSPLDVDNTKISNLLISGHEDGSVRIWSLALGTGFNFDLGKLAHEWQLKLKNVYDHTSHVTAITSIYVPEIFECFFSGDSSGVILRWEFNMEQVVTKSAAEVSKDLLQAPDVVKGLNCSACNRRLKTECRHCCRSCRALLCWSCKLPHFRTMSHYANCRPQSPSSNPQPTLTKTQSSELVFEGSGLPIFPRNLSNEPVEDKKEESTTPPEDSEINKAIDTLFE